MKTKKKILYARKCDVTGEGMNEGWCWGEGLFYTKYKEDTISELRKDNSDKELLSDDQLLENAVEVEDLLYWTEWQDESDFQYEEVEGKLVEIEREKKVTEVFKDKCYKCGLVQEFTEYNAFCKECATCLL
jgi:hypothetical protein